MKTVGTANYSGEISKDRVWFEHNDFGEDDCVTMHVRNGIVTDYEYCYEIPSEIQAFMIKKGYDLTEVLV
jgi:hypothetical protein